MSKEVRSSEHAEAPIQTHEIRDQGFRPLALLPIKNRIGHSEDAWWWTHWSKRSTSMDRLSIARRSQDG